MVISIPSTANAKPEPDTVIEAPPLCAANATPATAPAISDMTFPSPSIMLKISPINAPILYANSFAAFSRKISTSVSFPAIHAGSVTIAISLSSTAAIPPYIRLTIKENRSSARIAVPHLSTSAFFWASFMFFPSSRFCMDISSFSIMSISQSSRPVSFTRSSLEGFCGFRNSSSIGSCPLGST